MSFCNRFSNNGSDGRRTGLSRRRRVAAVVAASAAITSSTASLAATHSHGAHFWGGVGLGVGIAVGVALLALRSLGGRR